MRSATAAIALAALLMGATPACASGVLFVLDASGSMWGQVDGEHKIQIARRVLADLVGELPADVDVGLEAYGHNRKDDCSDIEVVAPMGSDRAALIEAVRGLDPKGMTPLTESIRTAAATLREREDASSIVVVSDGKETCDGDPCAAAAEALAAGAQVRIHVVGFDVTAEEAGQLECIAENGGGRYFGAKNAAELVTAFAEVKEEVAAPEPVPEPEPRAEVFFEDDFTAPELGADWEVLRPNAEAYVVDEGKLLALSATVGSLSDATAENVFRLAQAPPEGDWVATARIEVDFQTGHERVYFGLYEDEQNHLLNVLSTETGSCYAGGSGAIHLYGAVLKMHKGKETSSRRQVWHVKHCAGGARSDLLATGQPMLLRLAKKGRRYESAVKMEGVEGSEWAELDALTLLQPFGTLAFGLYQASSGGESSVTVDWVKVETSP